MKSKYLILSTIAAVIAITASIAISGDKPSEKETISPVKQDSNKQLLFFLNPNGRPCQIQTSILQGMEKELTPLAEVKYIQTTDPSVRDLFYKYGIRGLPSLIIVDKDGSELKRFSPGIQEKKAILDALNIGK